MPRINNDSAVHQIHIISGWTSVTRDVYIDYDLEEHPLQIKTNSAAGTQEKVYVQFYTAEEEYISDIRLYFAATPQYLIGFCSYYSNFPVDLPTALVKIWTITRTATTLVIACNDVEVVNYVYSDSSDSNCVPYHNRDVDRIFFYEHDTASDEYRQEPTGAW